MTDDGVVEVSMHIEAQPETVFPYFTDPGRYIQWMGAGAVLEPMPGGCYRILMRDGVEAAGEFVEIDPPRRLQTRWMIGGQPTTVTFELRADGAGTVLRVEHDGRAVPVSGAMQQAVLFRLAVEVRYRKRLVGGGDTTSAPKPAAIRRR